MSLGRNPAILRLLRRFVRWPGAITIAPALLPLLCAIAAAPALLPLLRTIAAVPRYCVASALLRLLRAIALLPHVAAAPHYCGCSGTIAAAPRYCHCSGTIAAAPALLPLLRIIAGQNPEKPLVFRGRFARHTIAKMAVGASSASLFAMAWLCPFRTL